MENQMDPNFVPDEFKVPYDIIELPSQGLLYPSKKNKVINNAKQKRPKSRNRKKT